MPGTTQYPELVDNNVELTDGVDIMEADNVNDAYAAIDAIETFLGASGAAQAKNVDVLSFLEATLPDMYLEWKDANTVTVKAGRIFCKKADGSIRVLRKNAADVDVTFADIDTGSRATNTQYYIWAVADASATTVTFKISASATTPTGVIVIGLVGKFRTNATGAGEIIEDSVLSSRHFYKNFDKQCVQAWINFNGTGTIAINDSFNVSGITDNGTGDYTITWDVDFADANYAVSGICGDSGSAGFIRVKAIAGSQLAGSLTIETLNNTGAAMTDIGRISIIAMGDR